MDDIVALLEWIKSTVTIGGIGACTTAVMLAGIWWKGLPTIIEAYTKRADAEAKRIDGEFARLERQIEASDRRHGDCEKRCEALQSEVGRLNKIIDGLFRQMRQMQVSAVRVGIDNGEPPAVAALLSALDKPVAGDLQDGKQ